MITKPYKSYSDTENIEIPDEDPPPPPEKEENKMLDKVCIICHQPFKPACNNQKKCTTCGAKKKKRDKVIDNNYTPTLGSYTPTPLVKSSSEKKEVVIQYSNIIITIKEFICD